MGLQLYYLLPAILYYILLCISVINHSTYLNNNPMAIENNIKYVLASFIRSVFLKFSFTIILNLDIYVICTNILINKRDCISMAFVFHMIYAHHEVDINLVSYYFSISNKDP